MLRREEWSRGETMVPRGGRFCTLLIAFLTWMPGAIARPIQIEIAEPESRHVAQVSARYLAGLDGPPGADLVLAGSPNEPPADTPGARLYILPQHALAREVPELGVVQLPFFYPDLAAIQRALDRALGERLKEAAKARGWTILAFWDEGMQVMSGNFPYTDLRSLQGREFLLLRDDPIAEIELRALDVWSRRASPSSLGALHKECLVASRSATLQQIQGERLERVHLDLTLTNHRYEGWVVAMRNEDWQSLRDEQRTTLTERLERMRAWQRDRAAELEASALRELAQAAMTAHPVSAETWKTYRAQQPAWEDFLSDSMTLESRRSLVLLAARASGVDLGRPASESKPKALPESQERQQGHRDSAGER